MSRQNAKSRQNFTYFCGGMILGFFLIGLGVRIFCDINMDRNCMGHLKRAADASTIELAHQEMGIALAYLKNHQLTEGYTSVIYTTPDEDINFWYRNLATSQEELETALNNKASQLEKSNILLKLRETLLDHGSSGSEILTRPEGISIYPYNTQVAFLLLTSLVVSLLCFGIGCFFFDY